MLNNKKTASSQRSPVKSAGQRAASRTKMNKMTQEDEAALRKGNNTKKRTAQNVNGSKTVTKGNTTKEKVKSNKRTSAGRNRSVPPQPVRVIPLGGQMCIRDSRHSSLFQ